MVAIPKVNILQTLFANLIALVPGVVVVLSAFLEFF